MPVQRGTLITTPCCVTFAAGDRTTGCSSSPSCSKSSQSPGCSYRTSSCHPRAHHGRQRRRHCKASLNRLCSSRRHVVHVPSRSIKTLSCGLCTTRTSRSSRVTATHSSKRRRSTSCRRPRAAFIAGILARVGDHRGHQPVRQQLQLAGGDVVVGRSGWRSLRRMFFCWGHNWFGAGAGADVQAAEGQLDPGRIRSPDPACNPDLAFALLLGAGLRGIEEGYDLPRAPVLRVGADEESAARWHQATYASLAEAIAVMETSELVANVLGEHVFEFSFSRNKREEWADDQRLPMQRLVPAHPLTDSVDA